jgi:hypothetical protein
LLVGQILPVFSLLAPGGAGASAPSVPRRNYAADHFVAATFHWQLFPDDAALCVDAERVLL